MPFPLGDCTLASTSVEEEDENSLPNDTFWNYQQDTDVTTYQTISTRDLICWSFQIARGMEYLAFKKVNTLSVSLLVG